MLPCCQSDEQVEILQSYEQRREIVPAGVEFIENPGFWQNPGLYVGPIRMIGTLINALTVLIGGTLGTALGSRFPVRMQETVFAAIGLFTLVVGMDSAFATGNPLLVLGSLLLGALVGEWLNIERRLEQFGGWLQRVLTRGRGGSASRFIEGFVTASIVFCVGPLTIQGAIEDGLTGDFTKLAIKAMLDGFAALAFSATLGAGVLASIVVILGFQGGISLLAHLGSTVFTVPMINELTATGASCSWPSACGCWTSSKSAPPTCCRRSSLPPRWWRCSMPSASPSIPAFRPVRMRVFRRCAALPICRSDNGSAAPVCQGGQ